MGKPATKRLSAESRQTYEDQQRQPAAIAVRRRGHRATAAGSKGGADVGAALHEMDGRVGGKLDAVHSHVDGSGGPPRRVGGEGALIAAEAEIGDITYGFARTCRDGYLMTGAERHTVGGARRHGDDR